jgi:hypothetical protein
MNYLSMMEEEFNNSPEATDFGTQFVGADDVLPRTCTTDRSPRLDIPVKGEDRVGFEDQSLFQIARVRVTSLVERMNEEIEKEKAFLDRVDTFRRMRLPSTANYHDSFELNDKNLKARDGDDDDTSSTGTVDTTEDFQEFSEELSDSWTSDSFSSAQNDHETVPDLRIRRIRERFLPFLPFHTSRTQKSDGIWTLQVYYEADHFRFDMHKQGETAVMTLYDDEARHTVQGLIDSMKDPKGLSFEVILRYNKSESLWLGSKDILPKLSEIMACG